MNMSINTIVLWFLSALVITGVSIMLYHLLLLFFLENSRKKLICGVITAVIVGTSVFFYVKHEKRNVIQMKEETLYVKPLSKIK